MRAEQTNEPMEAGVSGTKIAVIEAYKEAGCGPGIVCFLTGDLKPHRILIPEHFNQAGIIFLYYDNSVGPLDLFNC